MLAKWEQEVLHPRNTDFGPVSLTFSHPKLRNWRIYDQMRKGHLSKNEMVQLFNLPYIGGGATVLTPSWTQNPTAVIALATLAVGNVTSGTLDLTAKWGGYAYLFAGKQGTTAQNIGVTWYVRRKQNTTVGIPIGPQFVGDVTAATSQPTMASSGNNAASSTWVTVSTGFSVGDVCFIDDTGNAGLGSSEWDIPQHIASTVTHTSGKNGGLEFAHNSTSAHATNHADVFSIWMPGGSIWEIVCSNQAATGTTDAVRALVETFDNVTGT